MRFGRQTSKFSEIDVMVTALGTSTKLLYIDPSYY